MLLRERRRHIISKGIPEFTYTGTFEIVDEGNGNWLVRFLTSGILKITKLKGARKSNIAAIGGGGGGGGGQAASSIHVGNGGGGGGGGEVIEQDNVQLEEKEYDIKVGEGGLGRFDGLPGEESHFGNLVTAKGGDPGQGTGAPGGNGGPGGRGEVSIGGPGGKGKESIDGRTYGAGGTGGASGPVTAPAGKPNTGDGGGGGGYKFYDPAHPDQNSEPGTNGGSGAVLWRNTRK